MLPQLPRETGRWNWIAEHISANKATEQKSRAAAAGTRPHQNITTLANNGKKEVREHKSGVKTSKVEKVGGRDGFGTEQLIQAAIVDKTE